MAHQAQGVWLAQACGPAPAEAFNKDELYTAMDQLNGQWVGLEQQLYHRAFPRATRLVVYDLTSVYFEGKGPEHWAAYGHSRDHRADRRQIIRAVATDTEGLPLHVSVLRGNRQDTNTLQGLLHTLRRRFGIRTATIVFDGGMSSELNLDVADGMDWATLFKWDVIYAMPREELKGHQGRVTLLCPIQLVRTMIAAHGRGEVAGYESTFPFQIRAGTSAPRSR